MPPFLPGLESTDGVLRLKGFYGRYTLKIGLPLSTDLVRVKLHINDVLQLGSSRRRGINVRRQDEGSARVQHLYIRVLPLTKCMVLYQTTGTRYQVCPK